MHVSKPAGKAYYDSLAKLYASWDVDFIKADDMSRARDPFGEVYHAPEIEALAPSVTPTPIVEVDDEVTPAPTPTGPWVRISASASAAAGPLAAQGQGLVEYALILVLVALVVIGILTSMGQRTSEVFDQVNCTLGGGEYHQDNGNGSSDKCK